jgi:thiamine pyrophosphate-dependent acetolactate synthase large subunit-like protein
MNVDRRKFLAGVAVAGTATAVAPTTSPIAEPMPDRRPSGLLPSAQMAAAETAMPKELPRAHMADGSDFMVDVIKTLDFEYLPANPASSFRGLHESLIDYGGNKKPEFLTCMHEESAVAMAHGYFKAAGKPLLTLCHGTVGLQHAAMAIYNAWCDRVPVIILGGTDLDAAHRPPGVPTVHSAQDINALVRDFTKWDDTPVSLQHFAQSFVRAYKIAMTPPMGPVAIALDGGLQQAPIRENGERLYIPRYVATAPPQGDGGAVREAARLLANAEQPVIVVDRAARSADGMKLIVELAEALQAPVVDQGGRMNFPNTHHLNQSGRGNALIGQADVILGLELADYWGTVNSFIDNGEEDGTGLREPRTKNGAKLISISSAGLLTKSNYQEFQRFQVVDIEMAADAQATLPALIEAVRAAIPTDGKFAIEKRGQALRKAWADGRERAKGAAAVAWDASPISTARLSMELWAQIKDLDWSLVSSGNVSNWPKRLWAMERYYNSFGGPGGYGVGYGAPAAVGAALANRAEGRFSVNIQSDGDLMYAPGVLWTAARHRIPLLSVMHNNHAYHQEAMHVQRLANRRDRAANLGKDMCPVGTAIDNPNPDYAKLASSLGWWSAGPIKDPNELAATLEYAVEVVKAGEPALVDVWTQPR